MPMCGPTSTIFPMPSPRFTRRLSKRATSSRQTVVATWPALSSGTRPDERDQTHPFVLRAEEPRRTVRAGHGTTRLQALPSRGKDHRARRVRTRDRPGGQDAGSDSLRKTAILFSALTSARSATGTTRISRRCATDTPRKTSPLRCKPFSKSASSASSRTTYRRARTSASRAVASAM